MKSHRLIIVTALLVVFSIQVIAEEKKFDLGLYVIVDDMTVSKIFYENIFQSEPYIDNGDFVGFSLSGSLFALFAKTEFEHSLVRGTGTVPYIRVNNIESEFQRLKALDVNLVHDEVVDEGVIKLFMFKDPDNNPIEFYSLSSQ